MAIVVKGSCDKYNEHKGFIETHEIEERNKTDHEVRLRVVKMRVIVVEGIKLIVEKRDKTSSQRRTYPRMTTPSPAIQSERVQSLVKEIHQRRSSRRLR